MKNNKKIVILIHLKKKKLKITNLTLVWDDLWKHTNLPTLCGPETWQ